MGRWGRFGERPGIRRATASVSECLGRGGSKGSVKLEMVEPVYELSPMNIESFSCFLESCLNLSFYFIKNIYIYIYLFIFGCAESLLLQQTHLSLVAVCSLLIVVVSLVVEHGFQGSWASVDVAHELSCPETHGIFSDQVPNWCPLLCKADS